MAESRVGKNLAICQWGTSFYRVFQYSTLLILAELSSYYYSWVNLVINSSRSNNKRVKCGGCRLHQSWLKLLWSLFLSSTSHLSWPPSISQSWHLVLLPLSLLVWPQHSWCFFFCMYYDTNYLPCPFLYFSIVFWTVNLYAVMVLLVSSGLCSAVCSLVVCIRSYAGLHSAQNRPNAALASTPDSVVLDNADLHKLMRT